MLVLISLFALCLRATTIHVSVSQYHGKLILAPYRIVISEAEYVALSKAAKEVKFVARLLQAMGGKSEITNFCSS